MNSDGPALPWANSGLTQHGQGSGTVTCTSTAATVEPNISVKERIEVRWQVTDEEGEAVTKWWGATIESRKDDQVSTWVLRYDALDDFEEELAEVTFLPQGKLENKEDGAVLSWRRPGEDQGSSEDDEGSDLVDLSELTAEQEALERTMGQTIEQAALQQMQEHLDLPQQQAVAAGFRTFADHIVSQLKERSRASGDYVVTADDVADIVDGFKRDLPS